MNDDGRNGSIEAGAHDSLHVLPLSIVPLETRTLSKARLVKTATLESFVELFSEHGGARALLRPTELHGHFDWPDAGDGDDATIYNLSELHSYDVYSLRIELRRLGLLSDAGAALHLSDEKKEDLSTYMRQFTAPLIQNIFDDAGDDVESFDDIIRKFRSPDKDKAIANLRKLAKSLNMELMDVPKFLEEYGDVYLSLSFYMSNLDAVLPKMSALFKSLEEMKSSRQLGGDGAFAVRCGELKERLDRMINFTRRLFDDFHEQSDSMWDDVSPERFQRVRDLIINHHVTMGGVLCGLSVKIDGWESKFGPIEYGNGSLRQRADFVAGEFGQGLEKIEDLIAQAPVLG